MSQKPYVDQPFPGWRISPDGKDFQLFESEEDMPEGWLRETPESFAKKGLGNRKPKAAEPEVELPLRPASDEHKHVEPASKPVGRPKKLDL
jgi:hypothetical protein